MIDECTCMLEIEGEGRNDQINLCRSGSQLQDLNCAVVDEVDFAVQSLICGSGGF